MRFGRWSRERLQLGRVTVPLVVLSLGGVAAVSIIAFLLLMRLNSAGIGHERREAVREAELAGTAVVAPVISRAVLTGEPAALALLDQTVRRHVLKEPVVRVKVWAPDGRILYSDEPRLIGRRFELEAEELGLLERGGATSGLSDLELPENFFERDFGDLLEVYMPIKGNDGTVLLFEAYQRYEAFAADGRRLWGTVAPALVTGLLVLQLINLGLAHWFARQIRRRDQLRADLLADTLDATNAERRRIAADLHDGVVQDLAAASVIVAATTRSLRHGTVDAPAVASLANAGEALRRSVGELRTLLIDFYPEDLATRGLNSALGDLAALARADGLDADLDVNMDRDVPVATQGLLYRVAQEAVRNVSAHARASRVAIGVATDSEQIWLEVADDGRGFDPDVSASRGHIGLRALRDLLTEAGGVLSIRSGPTDGTVVRAELPLPAAVAGRRANGRLRV
jgi:signal transduction histidine kinase